MGNRILTEEEYKELKKSRDSWRDRYYELRYDLRKDERLDESIPSTDIPSDVEMIEDLKKRAADSDYYKEKSELLEERNNNQFDTITEKDRKISEMKEELKKANELADSWKRDYEFVRDQLIHPIYDILYPYNPNRDINVTDFINNVKDLKVYSEENGSMYKEIQEWREKCIARGKDIDHLLSENKEKDKKISELESRKEECEKKYRDEIKGLKKEIINLGFDRVTVKDVMNKNTKLNQTISDQEITIKALLITIKEMCKDE